MRTPSSSIRLEHGGFEEGIHNDCDATLVYVAPSATSDDAKMLDLARRCRKLREGARVVTMGKRLPSARLDAGYVGYLGDVADVGAGGGAALGEFEVAWQCQVEGCGRGSAVAYVHHRAPPLG